jgi:O-acetyl-ADP-ribose deacetylase (regulator of RNase III)
MTARPLDPRIQLVQGDIVVQQVDAIVNAANSSLQGGSGVDGAVHRAAGPQLLAECLTLNGCPTGEARITGGYDLPARWVIHTVGPIWHGGQHGEAEQLARCYRSVYAIASEPRYEIGSIAFPAISAGVYGYPADQAARIALNETRRHLEVDRDLELVRFVLYSSGMLETYRAVLDEL